MKELIYQANELSEEKGEIVLTFKGGQKLTGTSRGIFDDEDDDGNFLGYVMLFDTKQLEYPIFVSNADLVAVNSV